MRYVPMNSIKNNVIEKVYLTVILAFSLIGKVVGCQIGYYGTNCTETCRYPSFGEQCQGMCNCTGDICNHITGCKTVVCEVGYYGQHCTSPCRYPNYGKLCQNKCGCSKSKCNHIYGCENITECVDGFSGENCTSPCKYPSYGRTCQHTCDCTLSKCNHINGCEIITECVDGYNGENCTSPCKYPSYGRTCQHTCDCIRSKCNHKNGCEIMTDCLDGYNDQNCTTPCKYPSYGRKCQYTCDCIRSKCSHVNGCEIMTETQMWTTIWNEGSENVKNKTFLEKYGKLVVIGSCTLFVTIVIAVCITIKTCVHTTNKQPEDKVIQSSEYSQNISHNVDTRITLYKSLNFNESFDPELYENTRYNLSSSCY